MKSVPRSLMITTMAAWITILLTHPLYAAAPSVLTEMPSNSVLVVATQPLAQVSGTMDRLVHQIRVMPPDTNVRLPDLLGMKFGIPNMIDSSSGLGLAVKLDKAGVMTGVMPDAALIIFLPVLDTAEAIKAMQAQPAPDMTGIWAVPMQNIFVKPAGKHLLISQKANVPTHTWVFFVLLLGVLIAGTLQVDVLSRTYASFTLGSTEQAQAAASGTSPMDSTSWALAFQTWLDRAIPANA